MEGDDRSVHAVHSSESAIKDLRIIGGIGSNVLIPNEHHCIGLGIVRGIDPEKGLYYVSVGGAINLDRIKDVNRLVRAPGNELPVCSIMDGFSVSRSVQMLSSL
jgi:hypothetical protein